MLNNENYESSIEEFRDFTDIKVAIESESENVKSYLGTQRKNYPKVVTTKEFNQSQVSVFRKGSIKNVNLAIQDLNMNIIRHK